jgi:RNA polymerase sigma-70 factor (sigma-E family)
VGKRRVISENAILPSYWDAAIIEASRVLGCEVVLSGDLSDGQDYAGVRVENPFRREAEATFRPPAPYLVGDRRDFYVMEPDRAVADLERFLADRGDPLLRTAALLAGGKEAGEDLLQAALERLLRRWPVIEGDPEGYLRRTLYHLAADRFRQQRAGRRHLRLLRAGLGPAADPFAEVELRDSLVRLLLRLPPRQRAVIVARYWEQLSEAEAAQVLGCSVGTVKSATARGLRRLRELSGTGRDPRDAAKREPAREHTT